MNTIPVQGLSAAFASDQIKQRRGNFGQTLNYVEASTVIQRLNEVLEGAWSFEVIETSIEPDEVVVRGRLTIGDVVKEQFGGSRITRNKDTGEVISLADDFKAATSDALKKCATLIGVGLHLYENPSDYSRVNGNSNRTAVNGKGNNRQSDRVTNQTIARIFDTARELGVPQKDVIALAKDTFGSSVSQLSPHQAEDLITLLAA